MQMSGGEFALVVQNLEGALKLPAASWVGEHDLYASLADAAVQQRDREGLQQYAPRAEETANQLGHALYQGIAQRAWGVLHRLAGDHAASEVRLNQALDTFTRLEASWQLGRTHYELGELYQAQDDQLKTRAAFTRALTAFESLRAMPDMERTRLQLESLSSV
jgi:hypothetical protein